MELLTIPTVPNRRTVESAVALACRAPSLHNSQPWRWVAGRNHLMLFSDPDRLLPATDDFGRQMVLSCGAALNHLQYAFAARRWTSVIERLPRTADRQLLATIGFRQTAEVTDLDATLALAIGRRRTERLPLAAPTEWSRTLDDLTALAEKAGARLEDLGERSRPELEAMSRRISGQRRRNLAYQAELRWWAGHSSYPDGIPSASLPSESNRTVAVGRDFPPGSSTSEADDDRAAILLLSTPADLRSDWLRCGEALSAVLLACTARGLATCPITHLTEQETTRTRVRELSAADGLPQVLIRVGTSARPEPASATPRRPLSEVLFREHSILDDDHPKPR